MIFLALRQLFSRPPQTILTFLAIMLGAAGYVTFSGIMLGFQEYIVDMLVNSDAQIKITPRDEDITESTFEGVFFEGKTIRWRKPPSGKTDSTRLTNVYGWFEQLDHDPRVAAYAPRLVRPVIFMNGKLNKPASFVGIDPARQGKVSTLERYMIHGKMMDLSQGGELAIIGDGVGQKLGLRAGDTLSVSIPRREPAHVKVVGIFRTGNRMVDESIVYGSLSTVQKITGATGEISEIAVRLRRVEEAADIASSWADMSRDKVQSWDQANESILSVFTMQDTIRNAVTFVIILIVSFGIYNILNMVVSHKQKDIAILRSIGYGKSDVVTLFLVQGMILGIAGGIVGLLVGHLACRYIETIEIFSPKPGSRGMALTNKMMVSYNYMIYVKAIALTFGSALVASILPARVAARLSPIEIIRGTS
ncbi:MAG: ABC transporter permease [Spirochaetia bacterium]|nr:ABC transporter permease [Spirochaetia bacterium]